MLKGLIKIVLLTTFIVLLFQTVLYTGVPILFGEKFYPIITFFFLQSIAIHAFFIYGEKNLDLSVPLLVMAAMSVRLITALMAVVTFIMSGMEDQVNFIITFFTTYLFYFVFEIISVLSNLRSNLK